MASTNLDIKVGCRQPLIKAHEDMRWRKLGNTMHGYELIENPRHIDAAAISHDGKRVVFGSPTRKLWVFDFDGASWNEVASFSWPFGGTYGTIEALSGDGKRLATGACRYNIRHRRGRACVEVLSYEGKSCVQVHEYEEGVGWRSVGNKLVGLEPSEVFCTSISLSLNGNRIAIGGSFRGNKKSSSVRIFEFVSDEMLKEIWEKYAGGSDWIALVKEFLGNSRWQQIGQTIICIDFWCKHGAVTLSSDGNIVAVGPEEQNFCKRTSSVRVYRYSSSRRTLEKTKEDEKNQSMKYTEQWIQVGPKIFGNAQCPIIGEEISLSAQGNIMAVSARGENHSYVRVFSLNGNQWNEIGNISMECPFRSLSLSSDGSTIAVDNYNEKSVDTFKYNGSCWVRKQIHEQPGPSVSLSSDGNRLAVASVLNKTAHLNVYEFM